MLLGTDILGALGIQVAMTTKGKMQNLWPKSEGAPIIPDATLSLPADLAGEQQQETTAGPLQEHHPQNPSGEQLSMRGGHPKPRRRRSRRKKTKGQMERGRPA